MQVCVTFPAAVLVLAARIVHPLWSNSLTAVIVVLATVALADRVYVPVPPVPVPSALIFPSSTPASVVTSDPIARVPAVIAETVSVVPDWSAVNAAVVAPLSLKVPRVIESPKWPNVRPVSDP